MGQSADDSRRPAHHPGDRPDDGRARRPRAQRRRADHPRDHRARSGCRAPRSTASSTRCSCTRWCGATSAAATISGGGCSALAARVAARGERDRRRGGLPAVSSTGWRRTSARGSSSRCSMPTASWCWPRRQGRREYALTVAPGQRTPIHAGAASKLLLAALPPEEQDAVAGAAAGAPTPPRTITEPEAPAGRARADPPAGLGAGPRRERAEHPRLRRAGPRPRRPDLAALSVPFLAGDRRGADGDDPPRGDRGGAGDQRGDAGVRGKR